MMSSDKTSHYTYVHNASLSIGRRNWQTSGWGSTPIRAKWDARWHLMLYVLGAVRLR